MRLSRYIFPVIICFLSFKFAVSKDYGGKTTDQMIGRDKRGSEGQFQAKNMLERHKQLARLFTALHLRAQFIDDNLAPEDFLAGIWDLKNGAVIDWLIHLNPDGIIRELESVMPNVSRIVTDDEKTLTDLKDVSEQFESVRSAVIDNWNTYRKSDKPSRMDGFKPINLKEYYSRNLAKESLDFLSKDDPYALRRMEDCSEGLKNQYIEPFLKIEQNKLEQFVQSMVLINPICWKSEEIQNISKLLTASKDYISKIPSTSFNISDMKYINNEDTVWSTSQNTHPSIFSARIRFDQNVDYSLSNLDEDLQNSSWLKEVLNETEIARKLNIIGLSFEKFNDEFNQFGSDVRSLNDKFTEIFVLISNLHKADTSFASRSAMTGNCFNVRYCQRGIEISPKGYHHFSEKFLGLKRDLERILKAISEIPDRENVTIELDKHSSDKLFWKNPSRKRSEAMSLLRKIVPFYEGLVMESSSIMTTNLLITPEVMEWWESDHKGKDKLFNDDCKLAFDFDAGQLKLFRNVSITYFDIQKRDLVAKFKKLMASIPTMRKLMHNMRETVENIKREKESAPKNANKFKFKNRENLLNFSSAVYCLEQIRKIDEMDAELGIFIEKGDEVLKAVATTKIPKYKKELEKIWEDWPEVKVELKRFRKSVPRMMLQIRDIPEKSLERIGQVYFWLSAVRLEGSFDLRKYRESLRLLDTNPAPELEDALRKLEVPMSMDWDLVHMNFARMPEVMKELQKDFDCFFDEKKCPEELKDRSMIMMEQYRKNMEKFYKIDLRKQLLSLAYGWSMAIVPPGLLLLTWLWIVGKFNKHYFGSEDDYETDSETDDSDSDDGYTSTDSNESNTAYGART